MDRRVKKWAAAWLLWALAGWASADCVDAAAQRYAVNVDLLWAISEVESSHNPAAVGIDLPDGNVALGQWQINTIHLAELAQYGISRRDLFDGCKSAYLGAWQMARCIKAKGLVREAVGCYVAGPASKNVAAQNEYIDKVEDAYRRRVGLAPPHASRKKTVTPPARPVPAAPVRPSSRMVVWNPDE